MVLFSVIVPMDNEGCAEGISALLQDGNRLTEVSEYCRKQNYSNCTQTEKLQSFLDKKV